MEATLKKWGNSQGIILPKSICEYLGIAVGDRLEVQEKSGEVTLRPASKRFSRSQKLSAAELFSGWKGSYEVPEDLPSIGNEIDWGSSVGGELAW